MGSFAMANVVCNNLQFLAMLYMYVSDLRSSIWVLALHYGFHDFHQISAETMYAATRID